MDAKNIVNRLKQTSFKYTEAISIKRELKEIPSWERRDILNKLKEEKSRSDNSDVIEVINDIINEFSPDK